ncbi:hypothetical protein GCM10010250_65950 [Streptomyces althioticus]|nr:hypothetical protein GCM10010250_65950 [Streptomyces althioticus]
MMYPLVRGLAAPSAPCRVPVAVTCRVLGLARQPYYRWLKRPVSDAELAEAYRANALFDAHRDDPEFGHRFLVDKARAAGEAMAERTAWGGEARGTVRTRRPSMLCGASLTPRPATPPPAGAAAGRRRRHGMPPPLHADLLVLGLRHVHGTVRREFRPTHHAALRHSTCPVALVGVPWPFPRKPRAIDVG